MFGDDGEEVTPVPIPNTEVKLFSADGSWGFSPCESRTSPSKQKISRIGWSFFVGLKPILEMCKGWIGQH
jgi:hypothetical protein